MGVLTLHDMSAAAPATGGGPAGLVLAPFRGWRYDESIVGPLGAVLAPPNDVISDADLRRLHARSPWNASELNRPASYAAAASTLADWIATGALREDPVPRVYAYEQLLPGGLAVRGLLGALALRPPSAGIVLPHEDTTPGPIADRLALMTATGADLEPILVVYDGGEVVARALAEALAGELLAQARTPDGVRHRLAAISGDLAQIAAELLPRRALIADGHHRYATYLRRQHERRAAGLGAGPWDFGLTLLVDAAQAGLKVRAIHRVLGQLPLEAAVAAVAPVARVTPLPAAATATWLAHLAAAARTPGTAPRPVFVLASGSHGFLVNGFDAAAVGTAVDAAGGGAALRGLAVTTMARYLLPRVFGFAESAGVDVPEASQAVTMAAGSDGTAILLPPITFHDVLEVAAEGDRMPRKSTLFLPKPASGLALRRVEDAGGRHTELGHLLSEVNSTS